MLPERGVAAVPERLIVDIYGGEILRVVTIKGSDAVQDGKPGVKVFCQERVHGAGKIFVCHSLEAQHLPRVSALFQHRSELPGVADPDGLFMDLPADGVAIRVVSGCGQNDPHRLPPAGAGAKGHHIPEIPVGLGVQFIENHTGWLISVLAVCFGGKNFQPANDLPFHSAAWCFALAAV